MDIKKNIYVSARFLGRAVCWLPCHLWKVTKEQKEVFRDLCFQNIGVFLFDLLITSLFHLLVRLPLGIVYLLIRALVE